MCSVPVFLVPVAPHLNRVFMEDTVLHPCYWGVVRVIIFCDSVPNKEMLGRSLCCLCISGAGGHMEGCSPSLSSLY